jgi:predicted ribosome quality control (RQC) complex YloA/Tae2 family protein
MQRSNRAPAYPPPSFDSVVLAAVIAECATLIGGRVQRVVQTGAADLAIVLRAAGRQRVLVVSAHTQWARCHLAGEVSPTTATPFANMVRGRLERGVLRAISAPVFERIVTLEFDTLEGSAQLIAELAGRHANIMMCEDGVIVGAHRQVPSRGILPGRPYTLPAQTRPTPATITADQLAAADAGQTWRAILIAVAGIGPPLAHEVCVRAGYDPQAPPAAGGADALVAGLREIAVAVAERRFAPALYYSAGGDPVAYAPFPLEIYRGLREAPTSMSAAVEAVTARAAGRAGLDHLRQGLASTVTQAIGRTRRALAAVAQDLTAAGEADRYRQHGELLLAYLTQVTPGADSVEVPGFGGEPVRIALDPVRTGVENAQAYFRRYARAQAALKRLPTRRADLEAEVAYLDGAATAINQAETEDDLAEIEQDLIAARLRRPRRATTRPPAVAAHRVFRAADGSQIIVGRSARENDYVTFEVARADDLWLHARGVPGAHVILKTAGPQASNDVIEAAARVAAYYSAARASGKVPVDVTRRRFVRRIRGGRPGQVHYTNERTRVVVPELPAGLATP